MLGSHKTKSGRPRLLSFLFFKFVMHKMWLESTDCMIPVVFFSLFLWKKLFEQISEFVCFFQGKFSETDDVSWTRSLIEL